MVFDNLEATIKKLYRYCLKLSGSSWWAEDLVQETILKTYKLSKENPGRDLSVSFLYTTAKNLFIDELRKNKRVEYFDGKNEVGTYDFTEYDSLIEILLATLPLKQAILLTLKDVFGYSTKEIASMLRVSNESIKTALHRTRKKLEASMLEEYYGDDVGLPNKKIIQGISIAIKESDPNRLFYYYRILEARNYKIFRTSSKEVFHIVDPDGNVLEISK
ncbi:RNA polymerase subunit sigma-24 [Bacillus sp. LL01]|uniref:RNA polymerase sigma factor n=1 Tax=Bacillus sp. LL01 TaxID=1665556 RepID=UPI00064D357C|nr:RNA polymerase sigma factor [Bacillus sp. LL01]KMJ57453.1 RNA polymerase subunit sigma-24 [Bacillus sp. LL01]